jgi:hypothetical protein
VWSLVMLLGRNSAKWMVRGGIAALALSVAHPALAQSATITAYFRDPSLVGYVYPGPANAVFQIPVTASVGGTCGFVPGSEPNANVDAGAIDTVAWTQDVPFVVNCTAPWRIAISSQNGALKTAIPGATGYATQAPYDVALTLPWNDGTTSGTINASCPVAQVDLAAGSTTCSFEGAASPTNGQLVPRSVGLVGSKVTVSAPAYAGPDVLVAGTYNDTLTVTISPAS